MVNDVYIYDSVRTPRGKGKASGALHTVKPIDLLTGLLHAIEQRNPDLDPADVDDIITGVVSPVGDQGMVIARTAAIAAGWPDVVSGVQLNRFCGSGLEAVNQAGARVRSGWEDLILAGGVESMSRVPMGSDGGALVMDPATNYDGYMVPQGISADLIATIEGLSREDVDTFAMESQIRAAKAQANGYFDNSIIPVVDQNGITILDHDEHVRGDTSVEGLGKLSPSFAGLAEMGGFDDVALQKYVDVEQINHVHHAGNSSGIVDGAALTVLGSAAAGEKAGMKPRARIVSAAVTGADPTIMLIGPGPASLKALGKVGMTPSDVDLVEINEAFASVAMRLMRDLGDYPHDQTNVNGGAIAMGHPLGATGSMILGTLLDELERRDKQVGLATLCIGGGMGIATVIERV